MALITSYLDQLDEERLFKVVNILRAHHTESKSLTTLFEKEPITQVAVPPAPGKNRMCWDILNLREGDEATMHRRMLFGNEVVTKFIDTLRELDLTTAAYGVSLNPMYGGSQPEKIFNITFGVEGLFDGIAWYDYASSSFFVKIYQPIVNEASTIRTELTRLTISADDVYEGLSSLKRFIKRA